MISLGYFVSTLANICVSLLTAILATENPPDLAAMQNLGRLRPLERDSQSVTYVNMRPPAHAPIERLTLKSPSRFSLV